ncbi:MAG TPA: polysaccharide deacetylase, partial [Rhodospirillaceae bacterium]|nr:polysaccharide deacetylase [Rhodospirillaceae bacterium]
AALKKNPLITLGIHPAAYTRLAGAPQEEILRQINRARSAHQEHFGAQPALFSYPFGEYSLAYRNIIEAQQFEAAFGQQSGAAYSGSDLYALPRFSITESYGDIERLQTIASSLPLPTFDINPENPYLTENDIGAIGFSVPEGLKDSLSELSCFISQRKNITQEIIGTRVELRSPDPFTEERTRVNCTMPGPEGEDGMPRWRWFGMLLINPAGADAADASLQQDEPQ